MRCCVSFVVLLFTSDDMNRYTNCKLFFDAKFERVTLMVLLKERGAPSWWSPDDLDAFISKWRKARNKRCNKTSGACMTAFDDTTVDFHIIDYRQARASACKKQYHRCEM